MKTSFFLLAFSMLTAAGAQAQTVPPGQDTVQYLIYNTPLSELLTELNTRGTSSSNTTPLPGSPTIKKLKDFSTRALLLAWLEKQKLLYGQKLYYGQDDRLEFYKVDKHQKANSEKVVAIIPKDKLEFLKNGSARLTTKVTLLGSHDICPEEAFSTQLMAASCTGFAIGGDVIATAGHCISSKAALKNMVMVFGYRMNGKNKPVLVFKKDDIYYPQEIVSQKTDYETKLDYALIRVDRKVPAKRVVSISTEPRIRDNQPVYVIGHPCGLPLKIAGQANVRDNTHHNIFLANLDTYGGNSGSPVFNAFTHKLEGMLIDGESKDFRRTIDSCFVSAICPDDSCRGELVLRHERFINPQPAPIVSK